MVGLWRWPGQELYGIGSKVKLNENLRRKVTTHWMLPIPIMPGACTVTVSQIFDLSSDWLKRGNGWKIRGLQAEKQPMSPNAKMVVGESLNAAKAAFMC